MKISSFSKSGGPYKICFSVLKELAEIIAEAAPIMCEKIIEVNADL